MDYGKIIDFLRQPQFVFVIAVTAGLIVFLPDNVVQKMGLYQTRSTYLPYIAVVFLVSAILFVIQVGAKGFAWSKGWRKKQSDLRCRVKQLETLTKEERAILKRFMERQTMTQRLDVDSGIVNGLMFKDIIYRATNRATSGFADYTYHGVVYSCDHNMQSWAWEYLNEHPELLADREGDAIKELSDGNET